MASSSDIANLALLKLGSGSKITSLTDASVSARAINACYDMLRKAELRANLWSFALKRTTLPALATRDDWGKQRFTLPVDYLRMVQVNDYVGAPSLIDYSDADQSPYAIESGTVVTDYRAPLKIRYVRDVTDEASFDALFVASFAARLALETCEQITNSNTKKQALRQDYADSIRAAVRTGAVEKPPALIADDSWIMGRL